MIKKLFVFILLVLFSGNVMADQVTANYNLVIPEEGSRNWISKISDDIISIDAIMNMVSADSGWTSDGTNVYLRSGTANVGVGTSSPTVSLDVIGRIRTVTLSVDTTTTMSGDLSVAENALFVNQDNGRVGIGTNAPTVSLDVVGTFNVSDVVAISGDVSIGIGNANTSLGIGITPLDGTRLLLPIEDDAITPTLGFDDGHSGIYSPSHDILRIVANSTDIYEISSDGISSITAGGFRILTSQATSTTPVFTFNNDQDTGVGRTADDHLMLIAGAAEALHVVETDGIAPRIGIGTDTPTVSLDVVGNVTLTSNLTNNPVLRLENTTDDATSAIIRLVSNRATPTDQDVAGTVQFIAEDSAGNPTTAARITGSIEETQSNSEGGRINMQVLMNGSNFSMIDMIGDNGTIGRGIIIVNNDGRDVNFRVETAPSANTFSVDGGTDRVGIGTATPTVSLDVVGSSRVRGVMSIDSVLIISAESVTTGMTATDIVGRIQILSSDGVTKAYIPIYDGQ